MTWLQKRRPCPRNHSVRSVWRASVLDQFWLRGRMCKIYKKTNGFRGACPPNHCVRNVSRAWSFPSAGHPRRSLDRSLGNLGTPWPPKGFSILIIDSSIHASIPPSMFFPHIPSCIRRRRERHAHEGSGRHRVGSGDRENPRPEGAKTIPGLPVMTDLL